MDRGVTRQYIAAFIGSLSVLMAGTSYGWINPLLVRLLGPTSELPMTSDQSSWVVSLIELGDLFSPIPAAILVDSWGRKPLLLSTGPMYIISWILVLTTRNVPVLYFVRILQGFGMGIAYTVLPMYLAEVAEPRTRGAIGSLFELMWGVGILLEYLAGPLVSYQTLTYLSLAVPIIFLFSFIFMPESPYFLVMVNKYDKAIESLTWLRGIDYSKEEMDQIEQSVKEDMKIQSGSWRDLFATPVDRRAFLIVQVATITKFMSGIGSVLSYSSQTFSSTDRSFLSPDGFTAVMGLLTLVATIIATMTVDHAGRRPLLLLSALGCGVCELLAALYYYLAACTTVDLTPYSWAGFTAISAYCVIFSLGLGPIAPILQAELFPSNTRGIASGITTLTDTFTCLVVMKLYEVIASHQGVYLNYLIYSFFSLGGLVVMYFIVPETKGRTFAQIQTELVETLNEKTRLTTNISMASKDPKSHETGAIHYSSTDLT